MAGEKSPIEYIDANKVLNKTGLLELSGQIKGYINTNMPQSYTLPTATTSTLGGVKVDGSSITIDANGVISATSSGGGSSYTFTNGLVESSGTVSWDLNDRIGKGSGTRTVKIGSSNTVNGTNSVAIGADNTVSGSSNVALGMICSINDNAQGSIAEGYETKIEQGNQAIYGAHAEGYRTIVASRYQHAEGIFNIKDINAIFQHITGNGTTNFQRSNAQALDWSGNEYLAGNLYVGCNDFSTTSSGLTTAGCGGSKVATESYVNTKVPTAPSNDGTYMLKCVVSSGTATYSWESVVIGGSY